MIKYLRLDPKPSDLAMVRIIKVRTGYRCKDIRWTVASGERQYWLGDSWSKRFEKPLASLSEWTSGYKSSNCGNTLSNFNQARVVRHLVAQAMTRGMVKSKLMHERKWEIRSQPPLPSFFFFLYGNFFLFFFLLKITFHIYIYLYTYIKKAIQGTGVQFID